MDDPDYCKHCKMLSVRTHSGLCSRCYYNPRIRNLYPIGEFQNRKDGRLVPNRFQVFTDVPGLPDEPTNAQPGSEEKLLILEKRISQGKQLFHPQDKSAR